MIKIFKWWWAWEFESIEEWLERMEAGGLRLVETRINGLYFKFEKCVPTKARYCVDYQTKLTPEYLAIINDDGWNLYQIGIGWYILRKEYEDERPNLYTDFEGLIARNKSLLTLLTILSLIEFFALGNLIWDLSKRSNNGLLAYTCILGCAFLAFITYAVTNLIMQIRKFSKKE